MAAEPIAMHDVVCRGLGSIWPTPLSHKPGGQRSLRVRVLINSRRGDRFVEFVTIFSDAASAEIAIRPVVGKVAEPRTF